MNSGERVAAKQVVPVHGLFDASEYGFSQCVTHGRQVFLAGQCGTGGDQNVVPFAEQCRAALDRVRLGVEAAGGTLDDIVTMTVFVTDMSCYPIFSEIRRDFFGDRFPASASVGVSSLVPPGAM